jgi:Rieske 2Fe-2S family protein
VLLSRETVRALSQSAAPFGEAAPLPRAAYVEPAFFELDRALFAASWVPAAHESEIARPGQLRAVDVAGERVLVARGADLAVYAFIDRCVHRGTPLTEGDGGLCAELSLTCPYHGLRYDLTGRADPGSAPALGIAAGARLPAVRAARWNGFVLVCLSSETAPCDAWMGPSPPWLERASHHALRLGRRRAHDVAANWKLLVENFQESHHFPHVHPSLEARTPWARSTSVALGERWLGGTMEIAEGLETVSEDGRLAGRPLVAHEADARLVHDALLMPAWLLSLQPDYLLSYRLVPRAPDRTTVIADVYFHQAARATDAEPHAVYGFWDRTNAEDRAICARQQRGVASPSFTRGTFARVEDGQYAFDRRIAEHYLRSAEASP